MKATVFRWKLFGFIFTGIAGVLLHFLYEWTNESHVAAIFSGVNESTWEHIKLLFFPMLAFSVTESRVTGKSNDCFWSVKLKGILLGMLMIPTLFYTLNGIFGKTPDWINIAIFFISAAIAYIYEAKKSNQPKCFVISSSIVLILLSVIAASFIIFTFSPPELPIFLDPVTARYGII